MRLHNKLATILIAMAAIILVLSTVSSLMSIHYHLRMFKHQQPIHTMMVDAEQLPEFDYHLEQALVQSTLLTFTGSLLIAVLIAFYVARRISAPLVEMKGVAERMMTGEWNSRVKVKGKDELAQLATSLNGLAEQLKIQELLRLNMSQDVAHELRTPLATLKSHMIALEDGIWEPTPDRIHACYEEIERIIALVSELEELHYMDSPEFRLQLERQPLAPAIHKATDIVGAAYIGKKVGLNVLLVPDVDIEMDYNRMIQVLVNLLTNALTHTGEGGQVNVKAEKQGEYIVIDIQDSGPGIPAGDLPYIFERFYRGDKSRNRKSGGSGIGLAIVKKLVMAHKGCVWAENHNGALFHIRLPLKLNYSLLLVKPGHAILQSKSGYIKHKTKEDCLMSHEQFQSCIEECIKCMKACNHCYSACLQEAHLSMMKDCIRLDRECADICGFAAQAMSINSSYAKEICRICAEVCEACGNECKKHAHEHCQRCAEACFSCADACRAMVA